MAKTDYKSVDQYLAAQPEAAQATLQRVRSILRRALPGADEVISYQIPAYKLRGRAVVYFSGWKEHYSLYPVTTRVIEAFARELAPYEVNHKGTARFPYDRPVPSKLLESIARLLAKSAPAAAQSKAAKKRSPAKRAPTAENARAKKKTSTRTAKKKTSTRTAKKKTSTRTAKKTSARTEKRRALARRRSEHAHSMR